MNHTKNLPDFGKKTSRIWKKTQGYDVGPTRPPKSAHTERPISALGLAGEAGAGLTWVDFNLEMPQETPIRWSLNSWAAQANHGHPTAALKKVHSRPRTEG